MPSLSTRLVTWSLLPLLISLGATAWSQDARQSQSGLSDSDFFETRIRPVLVERCYSCHNSTDTAEAELAVDWAQPMQRGGANGPLLQRPASESLLIRVLRHQIDGMEMPAEGPKLDQRVIADFEHWIERGAPDPRRTAPTDEELAQATSWNTTFIKRQNWWSFRPVSNSAPPRVDNSDWPTGAIDQFTLSAMQEKGLGPAATAEKRLLARRLYYALVGLPPTAEQIAAFERDKRPDAYRRLVEELLQSPHYGEHWARHWMDWVRYAESHGSEGDPPIVGAHHYRDYLIRALNADVGYDQLLREHIAGDLLEEPRINEQMGLNESVIGTAHWRFVFHGFAPTDALDERVRFTDDAINVFSKAWMGITVSCARCHNHKFDAISQADYYALYGVLASTRPGRAEIDLPSRLNPHAIRMVELKQQIRSSVAHRWQKSITEMRDDFASSPIARHAEPQPGSLTAIWQQFSKSDSADFSRQWAQLVESQISANTQPHQRIGNAIHDWDFSKPETSQQWFHYGTGLAGRRTAPAGSFTIAPTGKNALSAIYPAGIYSHLLSDKQLGRLTSPDFQLDEDSELWLQVCGDGKAASRYVVQNYPRNGTVYPVKKLDGSKARRWHWQKFELKYWKGDSVHIELATSGAGPLLFDNSQRSWFGIRRAAVVRSGSPFPPKETPSVAARLLQDAADSPPRDGDELANLICDMLSQAVEAWMAGSMTDQQALILDTCLQQGLLPGDLDRLPEVAPLIRAYRSMEADIPVARSVPSLDEWRGADHPLFERGNHHAPSQVVPRRFLQAFNAEPYDSPLSGRAELAKDLLSPHNPLPTRVVVNRIWHHLFGQGLVTTPDNFGRLGALPTHPELLDYLATQFRHEHDWSIKSLVRQIVNSRTWRQTSQPSGEALRQDPENKLLTHSKVRRLEAESIRDSLLQVSARLDDSLYGPSASGNTTRRSIYVRVKRNALDEFLSSFDAPVPFSTVGRRDQTNVPAQSLLMLNSPFVTTAAKSLAGLPAVAKVKSTEESVEALWRQILGRSPTTSESRSALDFANQLDAAYKDLRFKLERKQYEKEQLNLEAQSLLRLASQQLEHPGGDTSSSEVAHRSALPKPIYHWAFSGSNAQSANGDLQFGGSASVTPSGLSLDGGGWATTQPITTELGAKTIAAVLQLSTLEQSGGGVITVQSLDGAVFDSIVYGEQQPARWLAGSDHFRRTQSFAAKNGEDSLQPIHIAISYAEDGTIIGYRNGQIYGKPYRTTLHKFPAGSTQITLGMRHGNALSKGRMLHGTIVTASVYDRALSGAEIRQLSSQAALVDPTSRMTSAQLDQYRQLQMQLATLETDIAELQSTLDSGSVKVDLAHALLNLKEFIYVR